MYKMEKVVHILKIFSKDKLFHVFLMNVFHSNKLSAYLLFNNVVNRYEFWGTFIMKYFQQLLSW